MARWMMAAKKADFDKIAEKYHITPVLARIMRNRDVVGDEEIERFLHGSLKDLHNPLLLKDIEKAAEVVTRKILERKRIRIIGDYDVDGITSTTVLKKYLEERGLEVRILYSK